MGGQPAELAFNGFGDPALPPKDEHAEALTFRCVAAAVPGIGDETLQVGADLRGDLGDYPGQAMTVIEVAWRATTWVTNWSPLCSAQHDQGGHGESFRAESCNKQLESCQIYGRRIAMSRIITGFPF